nr:deoxyguanosinetriphosphate triphosphohydrolase [uncultured Oribacterium sp.]
MTIREEMEELEKEILSPYACLSMNSLGRDFPEEEDDIRTIFQRDRDRILHSKAFRRLKQKTQVFIQPEGDHYRTRLTHTLEVSQIARSIAKALRLNEDLTEAIALGHDLGHTPYGHAGERALQKICSFGFSHVEQSIRVVEVLEKNGRGLNLSKEVRDGIKNHRSAGNPSTLEGQAVRLSDKIAYLNHDVDDAIRGGILSEEDLPEEYRRILGRTVKERMNTLIRSVIFSSIGKPRLSMDPLVEEMMQDFRKWMFTHVYRKSKAKEEEWKVEGMIRLLFTFYMEHPDELTEEYRFLYEESLEDRTVSREEHLERVVCDYISGMTDEYCNHKFMEYFVPKAWAKD